DYVYGYNQGIGVRASGAINVVTHGIVVGQNSVALNPIAGRFIGPIGFPETTMNTLSHLYEEDDLWNIQGETRQYIRPNPNPAGEGGVFTTTFGTEGFGIGVINNGFDNYTTEKSNYIQSN